MSVPTEDSGIVETAVRILEEWAHEITLDPQEVERERGVIVEEWRLGRGADARMADEQYPVLFHGSRYAERLPIGELSVIQSADREELVRFYRDWYRPELMSVVAVGDVDPAWMESLVRERFGRLPAGRAEPERPAFDLPPHEQTLYAPATDPEATSSRVAVYMKHAAREVRSFADYRRELVEALYTGMINERFREIARQAEAPFVGGYAFSRRLVRSADGYILAAQVRDGRILPSLESLLVETERVRRYGFTASELQRRKEELMTWIEQAYRERDNQESDELARSYVDHFLDGEPIPSLELEYELFQRYLPEISLEEVNDQVRLWLQEQNRVVLVNAPESEAASVPSRQEVLALFAHVAKRELDAYEDRVVTEPLLAAELSEKAIVERREIPELGVTQWRLANGVQVVLKPTTFKRDEILFGAFSPGGTSLVPDRDYVAAATAAAIVARSGVGPFDDTELRRILAGKAVEVTPWLGELQEGLQGSARPEDLETLFQLIYLYFTEPRKDPEAYAAYKNRLDTQVRNRRDSPGGVFWDTVREVLTQGHVRGRPWSTELLEEMDLDTSLAVYRERFRDAGDFTFVFAGSLDVARVEPLVRKYLGSLPSTGREETWRDLGVDPPNGVVQREVRKGLEPQSRVLIAFSGTTPWSLETRLQMEGLKEALDIRLREVVREEAGGSYDVGVYLEFSRDPDQQYILYVSFGCAPEQVQRLTGLVFEEAERIRASGPPEQVAAKAREILRREHEQNVRENSYWVSSLELVYSHGLDPLVLQEFDRRVSSITATNLRELSRRVLDPGRYVRVVLMPEEPK
jgi:zinc protease